MLTKYILHIAGDSYELNEDSLKNWDDIRCSYKRSSYDGVIRSFTSKFEFVNQAYQLLYDAYQRDGFNAEASLEVLTMNDRWTYDRQFMCPLDFTTIEWDGYTLGLSAVDNTLSALIKANKSTKYELSVGSDVKIARSVRMPRIPMQESITYGFTQGTSDTSSADITVTFRDSENPWVGNKGSEIVINQAVDWRDDQGTEPGSYLFKVIKNLRVKFSYSFAYDSHLTEGGGVRFNIRVIRDGILLPVGSSDGHAGGGCGLITTYRPFSFGDFATVDELPDVSQPIWADASQITDLRPGAIATVDAVVWECVYIGYSYEWKSTGKRMSEYFIKEVAGEMELNLINGDTVYLESVVSGGDQVRVRFSRSEFIFDWMGVGEEVYIDTCTPQEVARSILQRIAGDELNISVSISDRDQRLGRTYILAAESIRAIDNARLYSSFSEFCDWMSAVFGYVYRIGEVMPPVHKYKQRFGMIVGTPYTPEGTYTGPVDVNNIHYNPVTRRFFYSAENKRYAKWSGWQSYNHADTGYPRTDTVFYELNGDPEIGYIFQPYTGGITHQPIEYTSSEELIGKNEQTIYFVHRSEVMNTDAEVYRIDSCRNAKYTVDTAAIYSAVTIGYDKKDYDSVNGRDEFNFNNTYTTGCQFSDKTLSLLSKYRADSYGIEFAVQKRSEDTTDSAADNDVFFVLCNEEDGQLTVDRSCTILNGISDATFNGAFSPMACVRANEGYICLQSRQLQLKFASSTGNSDAVIDGVSVGSDLTLYGSLATVGTLEFTTDMVELNGHENDIIEVVATGVKYRGFLKEVDIKYSRAEAAKYKLIVTEIES